MIEHEDRDSKRWYMNDKRIILCNDAQQAVFFAGFFQQRCAKRFIDWYSYLYLFLPPHEAWRDSFWTSLLFPFSRLLEVIFSKNPFSFVWWAIGFVFDGLIDAIYISYPLIARRLLTGASSAPSLKLVYLFKNEEPRVKPTRNTRLLVQSTSSFKRRWTISSQQIQFSAFPVFPSITQATRGGRLKLKCSSMAPVRKSLLFSDLIVLFFFALFERSEAQPHRVIRRRLWSLMSRKFLLTRLWEGWLVWIVFFINYRDFDIGDCVSMDSWYYWCLHLLMEMSRKREGKGETDQAVGDMLLRGRTAGKCIFSGTDMPSPAPRPRQVQLPHPVKVLRHPSWSNFCVCGEKNTCQ